MEKLEVLPMDTRPDKETLGSLVDICQGYLDNYPADINQDNRITLTIIIGQSNFILEYPDNDWKKALQFLNLAIDTFNGRLKITTK